MEYTVENTIESQVEYFATIPERLPTSGTEVFCLVLSFLLFLNVITCILTTGRRLFDSPKWNMKFKGFCLVILTVGQLAVGHALMERSLSGDFNEMLLLSGISLWVVGRHGLTGSAWLRKNRLTLRKKPNV